MTRFLEDPVPAIVLGIIAEIALIAMLLLTGQRSALLGMVAVCLLAALGVVIERQVVTEREKIEDLFAVAAHAVEVGDKTTILSMLDPQSQGLVDSARRMMRKYTPKGIKLADQRIEVDEIARTATADMLVVATFGSDRMPQRVRFNLREVDGRWLITRYEIRNIVGRH
jgi:hypothetical protein